MSKPLVYLVLGCRGSGQFKVVSDLIEFGMGQEEKAIVYCSSNDMSFAEEEFSVKTRESELRPYGWQDGTLEADVSGGHDIVFIIADGVADPADFMESFHGWLSSDDAELGRVLTVLHTDLAITQKEALDWFDCCIHFSDVVLLAKRESVSNKQVQELIEHYEEECFPCLFEYVKKGRVSNPALVLAPQPRRISRIFDTPEVFDDDDEEEREEELEAGDPAKDKFLRKAGGGRRQITLPDIAKYL